MNPNWRGVTHHVSKSNHRDVFLGKTLSLEGIAQDVKRSTESLNLSHDEKNKLLLDYKKPNKHDLVAVEERLEAQNAPKQNLDNTNSQTNAPKR